MAFQTQLCKNDDHASCCALALNVTPPLVSVISEVTHRYSLHTSYSSVNKFMENLQRPLVARKI